MAFIIRQATKADANNIAPLIYEAIGNIALHLTAAEEPHVVAELIKLIQAEDNRHTYEHTFVIQEDQNILGTLVLYDGKRGRELDYQLMQKISHQLGKPYLIDVEAHDDELYIDTVCVTEAARGRGIGTQLLQFAEKRAIETGYQKLSLNVELSKEKAKKLYEKLGFVETERWSIIGEPFYHMVKQL